MLFIVKSACRVADDNISVSCLCGRYCVKNYCRRVAALVLLDNLAVTSLCPDFELFNSGGSEGVACRKNNLFALLCKIICKLAYGSGLAHAVYTDNEND